MIFLVGAIYLSSIDAKGVFTALLGRKIEQVEDIACTTSRIVSTITSQKEYYCLEISFEISQIISLEIPKRVYDGLVDGLYYRIFYAPRTKYLVSVEVLNMPANLKYLERLSF
jgi:hypothetical protein